MLKQHHHTYLNHKFVTDCHMWLWFLTDLEGERLYRPYLGLSDTGNNHLNIFNFFSDASKNVVLGMGAVFNDMMDPVLLA